MHRRGDAECKRSGFCPRCGGRPMTERAAHAVVAVLPRAPVRQLGSRPADLPQPGGGPMMGPYAPGHGLAVARLPERK